MYGRSSPEEKLIKIQSSDNNKEPYLFKHGNGFQVRSFGVRRVLATTTDGAATDKSCGYTPLLVSHIGVHFLLAANVQVAWR